MGSLPMPRLARVVVCASLAAWTSFDFGQSPGQPIPGASQPAQNSPQAGSDPPEDPPSSSPAAAPVAKPVPPTPIAEKKADLDEPGWDPAWSRFIEKSLPLAMLSADREREVKSLCPRFRDMDIDDRRVFWAYIFQALASAEAGLKPTANVRHNDPEVAVEDTVTHRIVRQEGLLQLAYMDSERYGCDFDWEKDKDLPEHDPARTILQPETNLQCGIRIMNNQVVTRHKPLLNPSSYWVTLQPGRMSFQIFMKQMVNEPAFCGRPRARGYRHEPTDTGTRSEPSR